MIWTSAFRISAIFIISAWENVSLYNFVLMLCGSIPSFSAKDFTVILRSINNCLIAFAPATNLTHYAERVSYPSTKSNINTTSVDRYEYISLDNIVKNEYTISRYNKPQKESLLHPADQSTMQEAVPTHHKGGRYHHYIGFLPEKQGGNDTWIKNWKHCGKKR